MGYPVCLYNPVSYPNRVGSLTSIVTQRGKNLRNSSENSLTRSAAKIVNRYT